MVRVFINGYGNIGRRVASAFSHDKDIQFVGIGKYSIDEKLDEAIAKKFPVYVPEEKIPEFRQKGYDISGTISDAIKGSDLVIDAAKDGFGFSNKVNLIFSDEIPDSTIASFLTALTFRGVNYDELRIIRDIMLGHSFQITPKVNGTLIDNCGTGGDMANSFNISTAASLVASASGINVAKHGNRSASGMFGSADFFEYIGFDLNMPEKRDIESLERLGYAFLFLPKLYLINVLDKFF